jgi:hypothetical protein
MGLLFAGLQAVGEGEGGFGFYLGILEILSSGILIVLTAREFRAAVHPKHPKHLEHPAHGVDWVDIAAGVMLSVEAIEHWHLKHHIARPTILSAVLTFALGLSHGRIAAFRDRRLVLRVTGDGISISARPFKARRLRATWAELKSIELGERWATVTTGAGRVRRLDLPDLEDEGAVRAALLDARQRLAAVNENRLNTAE